MPAARAMPADGAGLDGLVAVVTGAASGMGAAAAKAFAARGASVAIADIDTAGAAMVARDIGGPAMVVEHDVTIRTGGTLRWTRSRRASAASTSW